MSRQNFQNEQKNTNFTNKKSNSVIEKPKIINTNTNTISKQLQENNNFYIKLELEMLVFIEFLYNK